MGLGLTRIIVTGVLLGSFVSAAAQPTADRAATVTFCRAATTADALTGDTEWLRDPEWRRWPVERAVWARGADIAHAEVDADVHLRLHLTDDFTPSTDGDWPEALAVFLDDRFLGVGRVERAKESKTISLSGLRPPHVASVARALGVKGALALGPRVALALRSSVVKPGERLTVDVYISGVPHVASYKLGIEIRQGLRGFFTLEEALLDKERPDFAFADAQSVKTQSSTGSALIEASAAAVSLDPTVVRYLGTYVFRISENAQGTFTIRIAANRSELRDEAGEAIRFRPGEESLLITERTFRPDRR